MSGASLLCYQPASRPVYSVVEALNVFDDPWNALGYFLELERFWSDLSGCTTEQRVFDRLKDLRTQFQRNEPDHARTAELSSRLREIAWYMFQYQLPERMTSSNNLDERRLDYVDTSDSPNLDVSFLPPLTVVEIAYTAADLSPHVNILFGTLPEDYKGTIFTFGVDKGILRPIGFVGCVTDNTVDICSFGVIMKRRDVRYRAPADEESQEKFDTVLMAVRA